MSFNAYIDVVNTSFSNYFTNTSNNDVVMYTDTSNQSIHLGTRLGAAPSMLKVTRSNVELNGDIALTQGVNITGLSISKRATAGTMQNLTTTVTDIPNLFSNVGNVTLALNAGQSSFVFVNSNNGEVMRVTENGSMSASNPTFTGDIVVSGDIMSPTLVGQIAHFATKNAPTGWLKCNGATVSRTTYANLFATLVPRSATVTITIASPGVVTWTNHGLSAGDSVYFTTTGALPTGLTATTTQYFVISTGLTTTTFRVSLTAGGAAVNTSGTQSGVHTAWNSPFGIGDGSTTFTLPDFRGIFLRCWSDNSSSFDIGRAFGTYQADQFASHTHGGVWASSANSVIQGGTTYGANGSGSTAAAGGSETNPKNRAVLACIKY
jgi:microcystin-dependent protein